MNLKLLKKTKKPPTKGDVFVFQIESRPDQYFYGRVIRTDAKVGGFKDTVLVYLYSESSNIKNQLPTLDCRNLLIPPLATNNLPWTKGYFEVICNVEIGGDDILPKHCFRDFRGWLFDDDGNKLSDPVEPVGEYGLHSYRTIDDAISNALGIPLTPDT